MYTDDCWSLADNTRKHCTEFTRQSDIFFISFMYFPSFIALVFRLDALAKALSVIATATWLGGWLGGCLSQPVLYQND